MEVGHDDGNLQSIIGCELHCARDFSAQALFKQGLFKQGPSKQALLAQSGRQRLTPLPP
jgi:hypothetical protein